MLKRLPLEFLRDRLVWILILLATLAYFWQLSCLSLVRFHSFGMFAYDFGIHVQGVWMLAFKGELWNTIRGMNVLGDHLWMIFFPMSVLYRLFPHQEFLLILQTLLLGGTAIPLALLASRVTQQKWFSLAIAIAWLVNPALHNMNLDEFHPEVVATFFLVSAVVAMEVRRFRLYYLWLILAIGCKEDIAITTFVYGFVAFRVHDRKHGIATMLISGIYFIASMKLLLPWLNDHGFFRVTGGYWFSGLWANKLDLTYYVNILSKPETFQYLYKIALPFILLGVFRPVYLLPVLPSLFINILSGVEYLSSIEYHYNNQSLPFLGVSAIYGFHAVSGFATKRLPEKQLDRYQWAAMCAFVVVACIGMYSFGRGYIHNRVCKLVQNREVLYKEFVEVVSELGPQSERNVSASYNLVPYLAHRSAIYMFPNPYRRVYWGIGDEPYAPKYTEMDDIVVDKGLLDEQAKAWITEALEAKTFQVYKDQRKILWLKRIAAP